MQLYATRLNSIKSLCYKLDHVISKRRLLAGLAIPTIQAIAADLTAQLSLNRKSSPNNYSSNCYGFNPYPNNSLLHRLLYKINWNRTMVFATFGFCYLGACQYVLYTKLLSRAVERIINPQNVLLDRAAKVIFDQCIHTPFMYFPAFYFIKDRLEHLSAATVVQNKSAATVVQNKSLYRLPSKDDIYTAWKIWIPAQCITFTLARHWRLPWISSVSFVWTVILSMRSMD